MTVRRRLAALALGTAVLAGCQPTASTIDPATVPSTAPAPADAFDRFPETVKGLGTEPFWSVEMRGTQFAWSSMEAPEPRRITVSRRESEGVLVIAGTLDGQALRGEFRKAACGDGMSDRSYPFTLSLAIGQARFSGCAYPGGMRFPPQ